MAKTGQRSLWTRMISLIAIAFGLLTIKEGGTDYRSNKRHT